MKVLNVITRVYLQPNSLEPTIAFYEGLFCETCRLRFPYPAMRLELAQVGCVLLIAGSPEDLEPFRATRSTFLVDSVDAFRLHLVQSGAQILSPPKDVPTGRNMRVRHPDGLVVEYVEHTQTTTKAASAQPGGEAGLAYSGLRPPSASPLPLR